MNIKKQGVGIGCLSIFYLLMSFNNVLAVDNLDGTTGTSLFQSDQVAFSAGGSARGFVVFMAGFTVPEDATVSLNVLTPVQGAIDLNTTGKITLEGDLWLGSQVNFSNGGLIDGQGHCIFLQGPLTLASDQVLTFVSDTVIDGQGHDLILEEGDATGAQLIIDGEEGTCVTFRNINIKGVSDWDEDVRSIVFGDADSQKIVLENATINLVGDYSFDAGALDINDTVVITGPYTFNFLAAYDCTITRMATLCLDPGLTFKYDPSDRSKVHLVMEDATSNLFLNTCNLETDEKRGVTFTNGHIIVDGRVVCTGGTKESKKLGFAFGNGTYAQDVVIDLMPAASLEAVNGLITYKNADSEEVRSCEPIECEGCDDEDL